MNREHIAIRTIFLGIFVNLGLALVKWLTGYFGNSFALIADAMESTTDIFSSFLLLFGLQYASKPADQNHPYGHGRAEPLLTFLVVGFLMASATFIAYESILNILTPHDLPKPYTLVVLGGIILVKEIFFRIVKQKSKEVNSTSLKAEAWHHRSDAITSVAGFVGISLALILGKGYESADDWAALLASGIILYNSYFIFRPALGEIMDEHQYDYLVTEIRKVSMQQAGIIDTEKCKVRKTGFKFHVDLHALVNKNLTVEQGHSIAHQLKDKLKSELPEIADVLIHVEPGD